MEITKPQIDIGLVTANPEAAQRFYGELLGFKQGKSIPLGEGVIQHRFFIGKNTIKINEVPGVEENIKGGMHNAIGIRLLALLLDGLDAIEKRFIAAGIKYGDPIDFPGAKLIFVKDPDGNLLELVGLENAMGDALEDRIQIGLCVGDTEKTKRFYGEILGFREEPPIDMGGGLMRYGNRGGDTLVKFWQAKENVPAFSGRHFDKIGLRYFTYIVKSLDQVHEMLKSKGVKIMQEPTDIDGVARILLAADPDENCVEFVEYY